MRTLTQEQARLIMVAHGIEFFLDTDYFDEALLLEQNNPELFDAYLTLQAIADGRQPEELDAANKLIAEKVSEDRLRNARAWALARPDISGSDVIGRWRSQVMEKDARIAELEKALRWIKENACEWDDGHSEFIAFLYRGDPPPDVLAVVRAV